MALRAKLVKTTIALLPDVPYNKDVMLGSKVPFARSYDVCDKSFVIIQREFSSWKHALRIERRIY